MWPSTILHTRDSYAIAAAAIDASISKDATRRAAQTCWKHAWGSQHAVACLRHDSQRPMEAAHREGGALRLHNVERLDVGARRQAHQLVVVVAVQLGERRRRSLPRALDAQQLPVTGHVDRVSEP